MIGSSYDEIVNSVLQNDLEREAEKVRREREERRLLALQHATDPSAVVGTSELAARIAAGLEAKLGLAEQKQDDVEAEAPPVEPEKEKPHASRFPPPPRLGEKPG